LYKTQSQNTLRWLKEIVQKIISRQNLFPGNVFLPLERLDKALKRGNGFGIVIILLWLMMR
jgi:hypothetical protein